jgi:hypothetical protein
MIVDALDDKHQFAGLAEQVRFLMMRGIETVQAERAGRSVAN